MGGKKERPPVEPPNAARDLKTIKWVTLATLVVIALGVGLTSFFLNQMQAGQTRQTQAQTEVTDYLEKHRAAVKALLAEEEGLTLDRLAFGYDREIAPKKQPEYRVNVHIAVDPSKTIADYEAQADALKSQLDAILTDPPQGARIRMILASRLVRE